MTPEKRIEELCKELRLPKLIDKKVEPLFDEWTKVFVITGGVCFLTFFVLAITNDPHVMKKLNYLLCSLISMCFAFARQLYLRKQINNKSDNNEKAKRDNLIKFPRNKS